MSRREFAKYLVVVSGGLAAGSAWLAVRDKLFPHPPITGEHLICKKQDVPVGGTRAFTLPGSALPYILINLGNDEWRAFEQKCTHLSCAVFYQPHEGKIECPCHNGWFDARTGAPLQGPPQRPLPQLQLEVRGDDIFVVPSSARRAQLPKAPWPLPDKLSARRTRQRPMSSLSGLSVS